MKQDDMDKVWSLWKAGKTYQRIGKTVGVSTSRIGYIIANNLTVSIGSGNWKRPEKARKEVSD